ncbi:MAG: flagellar hook-basal body complex protein [Clostridia bacterium]|jgi:flagellar hook protein FlgE|nr:flagellar hook-basal body complex protein [Clostridia bacterium]MDH7573459.1 flagellar hook-basal body complex protein [Clostridia bacterium]
MMRSMYSAVSGLRNHQIRMDVIGNNIANVNTVAFKSSRVTFQDTFYQLIRSGAAPVQNGIGGTTPRQVGIGMAINTIDTMFTQGAVLPTGNFTDLMIQGDGLFILSPDPDTDITVSEDGTNLTETDDTVFFTRAGVFGFDAWGNLVNKSNGMYVLGLAYDSGGNLGNDCDAIRLEEIMRDLTGDDTWTIANANTITINSQGQVVVDGEPVAVVALAKFPNPEGLLKKGENLFVYDPAAGSPQAGTASDSNAGLGNTTIVPGALEMSNVDLALEFTEMITTQRGFQANARTITTSDEMLQELVNLKR